FRPGSGCSVPAWICLENGWEKDQPDIIEGRAASGSGAPAKKNPRTKAGIRKKPVRRSGRGDPGLLQLGFLVVDVLARDRIKFLDQHLFRHVALVFRGRVEMTRAGGRLEPDFLADAFSHDVLLCAADQASSPRARRSARTASMPFLSMVRRALVDTRRRAQRFSDSTQNRRDCRLGRKRRLVLLFACETLLPTIGPLPVTWHTRAMVSPLCVCIWKALHSKLKLPGKSSGLS